MDQAVSINSIPEEHEYVARQKCQCGGNYRTLQQALIFTDAKKPLDRLHAACTACGAPQDFWFDISSFFGKPLIP
ncbi:MAG: hypothetical protein ACYCW6_07590 [Candidatus Xenobia bacterium]